MVKEINALELRKHFGQILDEVHVQKETFLVTKNGRPVMVLMNVKEYEEMKKTSSSAASPKNSFIETYSRKKIDEFLKRDTLPRPS